MKQSTKNIILYVFLLVGIFLYTYKTSSSFFIVTLGLYLFFAIYIWIQIKCHHTDEYTIYPLEKKSNIPCSIYTYWHNESLPISVQKCLDSWKRFCPHYSIHLITEKNIDQYIPSTLSLSRFTQTQRSDFVRIYALKQYGGIWMDASIYLNRSLDWVHAYQRNEQSEFVGFKVNSFQSTHIPVIDSWFMACVPESNFMNDLQTEFTRMTEYDSVAEYIHDIKKTVHLQKIDDPYYLTIHASMQYVIQKRNYTLSLLTAENGPLLYLDKMGVHELFFPFLLFLLRAKEAPIVKFRGCERNLIETLYLTSLLD